MLIGTTPAPVARKRRRTVITVANPPTPAPTPALTTYQHQSPSITLSGDGQQAVSTTLQSFEKSFRQELLDSFRNDMARYFPFLTHGPLTRMGAPDSQFTDVTKCEEKVPFTIAAASMAALHRHCVVQRRVAQELLVSLSTAMILQGRKSLDLLYCITILEACQ